MRASLLFFLSALTAWAASPSQSTPPGGVTRAVVTNIVNAVAPSVVTNIVSGTNALYFTNECYVTANQDTNVLVVSGAGTASANGTYRWCGSASWTNASGVFGIYDTAGFEGFVLTNSSGASLYESFNSASPTNQGWQAGAGMAPAPSVIFGPVTNCFTVIAGTAVAMPAVVSNTWFVAMNGNDTNAIIGRLDRPFRNYQPALLAARPGQTVFFWPGLYPALASHGAQAYVSNGVSVIGSGRGVSILGTEGGVEEGMQVGGVKLHGFTFFGQINVGGVGTTATNGLLDGLEIIGNSDGVYVSDFETLLTLKDCRLVSSYDGLADWEASPGGSNRVIRIINTEIIVTNIAAFGTVHGISGNDNRIEMFGGSIDTRDGHLHCFPIYLSVDTFRTNKTGSVLLSNVRIRNAPTNQTALFVTNFNNLPVFMDNCTMETIRPTLISGSYTQRFSDRFIDFPNGSARTNRLPDTRALTNALMAASAEGFTFTLRDAGGTAFGTNVQIFPSAGQTIDGQSSIRVDRDWGEIALKVTGTNWAVVHSYPWSDTNGQHWVRAGMSTDYARVGGVLAVNTAYVTNAAEATTVMITNAIKGHTLTNAGDSVRLTAGFTGAGTGGLLELRVNGADDNIDINWAAPSCTLVVDISRAPGTSTNLVISANMTDSAATTVGLTVLNSVPVSLGADWGISVTGFGTAAHIVHRKSRLEWLPAP